MKTDPVLARFTMQPSATLTLTKSGATLDSINWDLITRAQAGRLLGAARARERAAAKRWDASDTNADKAAWDAALELEENLLVFARCGAKPGEH